MLAKISSEMPLPIPRWVISSPIHISSTLPAVSEITIRNTLASVKFGISVTPGLLSRSSEQEHVADRLREREADGQVARVLRDPRLADLAFLRELLQRRDHDLVSSCRMIEAVM